MPGARLTNGEMDEMVQWAVDDLYNACKHHNPPAAVSGQLSAMNHLLPYCQKICQKIVNRLLDKYFDQLIHILEQVKENSLANLEDETVNYTENEEYRKGALVIMTRIVFCENLIKEMTKRMTKK